MRGRERDNLTLQYTVTATESRKKLMLAPSFHQLYVKKKGLKAIKLWRSRSGKEGRGQPLEQQ